MSMQNRENDLKEALKQLLTQIKAHQKSTYTPSDLLYSMLPRELRDMV